MVIALRRDLPRSEFHYWFIVKENHLASSDEIFTCSRYASANGWTPSSLHVIRETTLTLSVNGFDWISFQCTPHEQIELACGFLFNEGVIERKEEIADAQLCPDGSRLDLWLTHSAARPDHWKRTSGCGGGATHQDAPLPSLPWRDEPALKPEKILALMDALLEGQALYRETGGIHSAALSNGQQIYHLSEDIGRHNTLDKLAGFLLLNPIILERRILLTTGRISSEMLQKAARIGTELIISRTSPTSESIRLADEAGITLAGYARHAQMIVYTHAGRLGG